MAAARRWLAVCVIGVATRAPPLGAQPALEGLTLEAAIKVIEAEGLNVFYSSDLVKPGMRVTVAPTGDDLREALRAILAPHGLTTAPGPRGSVLIVVSPPARPLAPAPARRGSEPAPRDDAPAAPAPIDELIVAASRYDLVRGAGTMPFTLSSLDLEQLPDLGDDALRAVQRLPGAATNGFSARANVRGGAVDETLVLLDGVRLYDPYHLESFQSVFSIIDPRIVSTMAVYTGAFPAMFGDRMSGVIDIASLEPPEQRYHEIAFSFFNASALSAGEFAGGDGEWVASVRRSNLDLLYNAFSAQPERPRYLDAFGKVAYRLGDTLRISASTLYSHDDVELADDLDAEERASARDEDRYAWLRLDHALAAALHGSTRLAHATLASNRSGVSEKQGIGAGRLVDRRDFTIDTLDSDWAWLPSSAPRWLVQFGGTLARGEGRYFYEDEVELELLLDAPGAVQSAMRSRAVELAPRGRRHALYGAATYRPGQRLVTDFGIRWDRRTLDPQGSGGAMPRFGLQYSLAPRAFLRAAWGRFEQTQEINELAVGDGEVRFASPQRAEHRVLGFEHEFRSGLRLGVEVYEKNMTALRPRNENLLHSLSLLPELKPDRARIAPDSATAHGIELRVEAGSNEALQWWASYSRASVKDSIRGVEIFRNWDQTHALGGGLSLVTPKWHVAASLNYRSGWPETAALELSNAGSVPLVSTGPRNAERAPSSRSIDVRVTRNLATRRGDLAAFLEITNALDHRSRCCMEYQIELDERDAPMLELSPVDYMPRVPSLGFVWSF